MWTEAVISVKDNFTPKNFTGFLLNRIWGDLTMDKQEHRKITVNIFFVTASSS